MVSAWSAVVTADITIIRIVHITTFEVLNEKNSIADRSNHHDIHWADPYWECTFNFCVILRLASSYPSLLQLEEAKPFTMEIQYNLTLTNAGNG